VSTQELGVRQLARGQHAELVHYGHAGTVPTTTSRVVPVAVDVLLDFRKDGAGPVHEEHKTTIRVSEKAFESGGVLRWSPFGAAGVAWMRGGFLFKAAPFAIDVEDLVGEPLVEISYVEGESLQRIGEARFDALLANDVALKETIARGVEYCSHSDVVERFTPKELDSVIEMFTKRVVQTRTQEFADELYARAAATAVAPPVVNVIITDSAMDVQVERTDGVITGIRHVRSLP
jgi:hypothetical protein